MEIPMSSEERSSTRLRPADGGYGFVASLQLGDVPPGDYVVSGRRAYRFRRAADRRARSAHPGAVGDMLCTETASTPRASSACGPSGLTSRSMIGSPEPPARHGDREPSRIRAALLCANRAPFNEKRDGNTCEYRAPQDRLIDSPDLGLD
jgi:hypothetical protein